MEATSKGSKCLLLEFRTSALPSSNNRGSGGCVFYCLLTCREHYNSYSLAAMRLNTPTLLALAVSLSFAPESTTALNGNFPTRN